MLNEHPVEMGLAGRERELLSRLRGDPRYVEMFGAAFPGDADAFTLDNVAKAIASFERTLISGGSPYNRLVWGGEMDALSDSARRGMRLFFSDRLRCSECHAGFTLSGPAAFEGDRDVRPAFHNTGLYDVDGQGAYPADNRGLAEHTGLPADMGRFRAPTLYNVAVTAPYMHDGSVATLDEVLDIYASGGRRLTSGPHSGDGRVSPNKSSRVVGFALTREDRRDVLAFLESLTDERFLTDPRFANPFDGSVAEAPTSAPDTGVPTTRTGLSASGQTTP
jgi:cytochrome c peroxidase